MIIPTTRVKEELITTLITTVAPVDREVAVGAAGKGEQYVISEPHAMTQCSLSLIMFILTVTLINVTLHAHVSTDMKVAIVGKVPAIGNN